MTKIRESSEPIVFNNLIYYYEGNSAPINFIGFEGPLHIFKSLYKGDKTLEEIEKEQIKFKKYFGNIKRGNSKKRSEEQQKTIDNIENLYNTRQKVVKIYNDYAKNISRNIYESKQKGTGLKI